MARFGHAARRLAAAARAAGLVVPAFRTPPRRRDAARTVRRMPGGVIIAVRLRGRPFAEVVADMVEGVVVTNGLAGGAATRVRSMLFAALEPPTRQSAA